MGARVVHGMPADRAEDTHVARGYPVADRAVLHLAAGLCEAELVDTAHFDDLRGW